MKKLLMIALITLLTYSSFARTCIIYYINGHEYYVDVSRDLDCTKLKAYDDKIRYCWNELFKNRPILQAASYTINLDAMGYTFVNNITRQSQLVMDNATINSYLAENNCVHMGVENDILTISIMDGNPILGPVNVVCIAYQKPISQLLQETNP